MKKEDQSHAHLHTKSQPPSFPFTPESLRVVVPLDQNSGQMPKTAGGIKGYFLNRIQLMAQTNLSLLQKLQYLPLVGYIFSWLNALIKLPLTRHLHAQELSALRAQNNLLQVQIQELDMRVSLIDPYILAKVAALDSRHTALSSNQQTHFSAQMADVETRYLAELANIEIRFRSLSADQNADMEARRLSLEERIQTQENIKTAQRLHQYDMLDVGTRLMRQEQLETERKIKQFTNLIRLAQEDVTKRCAQFPELERRLSLLEKSGPAGGAQALDKAQIQEVSKPFFDEDKFFFDFEETFRGDRSDIKQRLSAYLPYLQEVKAMPETQRPLFVDIGCGRGEWLELMSEQGIPSIGIDLNHAKVDACIGLGYAAKVADGIAFLLQQEENSLGGVSGFHLIEHLSFDQLIALFKNAWRALKPGGVLIFETPNPENLLVGACNFFSDPTHVHPIVPNVARFMAQQAGFADVEILRLHPYPNEVQMQGDSPIELTINHFLFGPQDFAVIAKK